VKDKPFLEADLISAAVSFRTGVMQIYVGKNGQQLGPFEIEEINGKIADGTFAGTDLAWYEGAAGWAALSTIPGVSSPASAGAAPASAATPAQPPAPTTAAAPIPAPAPVTRAPIYSAPRTVSTPGPANNTKTLSTISWVLLGGTLLVSLIPFLGCGATVLSWAVAIAAIIMGIIIVTRGATGRGVGIIIGGVLIVPLAILGQFASLAILGSVTNTEQRKNETQILENLRLIDTAKGQWASATNAVDGSPVTMANLTTYFGGKEVKAAAGEDYAPMPVGRPPTATLPANKGLGDFKGGDVLTIALLEQAASKRSSFSFYSFKNSPAPSVAPKALPSATVGGKPLTSPEPSAATKPSISPKTTVSPKPSISPQPSESVTPPPPPSSSVRPSPSAKFGPQSSVSPKSRTNPSEPPSSTRPSPSAKFAPPDAKRRAPSERPGPSVEPSASEESSGPKTGRQNPRESPSASPDEE